METETREPLVPVLPFRRELLTTILKWFSESREVRVTTNSLYGMIVKRLGNRAPTKSVFYSWTRENGPQPNMTEWEVTCEAMADALGMSVAAFNKELNTRWLRNELQKQGHPNSKTGTDD